MQIKEIVDYSKLAAIYNLYKGIKTKQIKKDIIII